MKILAIIPARGGSKGVPRKNLKELFGKPLIVHTIEQAKKSKLIDKIVVSTEDPEIKKVAEEHKIEVIDRPKELATDDATTESVIEDVINKVPGYNVIVLLQCTSPMRNKTDIDCAIRFFIYQQLDTIVSVKPSKSILWKRDSLFAHPITYKEGERPTQRQDINLFEENGSIYVFYREKFLKEKSRICGFTGIYIMPEKRSIDIDTEEDFEYLEWKYGNNKN